MVDSKSNGPISKDAFDESEDQSEPGILDMLLNTAGEESEDPFGPEPDFSEFEDFVSPGSSGTLCIVSTTPIAILTIIIAML